MPHHLYQESEPWDSSRCAPAIVPSSNWVLGALADPYFDKPTHQVMQPHQKTFLRREKCVNAGAKKADRDCDVSGGWTPPPPGKEFVWSVPAPAWEGRQGAEAALVSSGTTTPSLTQ